jgi:hypothetical protein
MSQETNQIQLNVSRSPAIPPGRNTYYSKKLRLITKKMGPAMLLDLLMRALPSFWLRVIHVTCTSMVEFQLLAAVLMGNVMDALSLVSYPLNNACSIGWFLVRFVPSSRTATSPTGMITGPPIKT